MPDPCADYSLACIGVTVESGPPDTYQLMVRVLDGYGSVTPLTPRKTPREPLVFPLRFAIRFEEFDRQHRGKVVFEIAALDLAGDVLGQVQKMVEIHYSEKRAVSVSIGPPFDLAVPEDLRPLFDLSRPDLATPPTPDAGADAASPDGGPS